MEREQWLMTGAVVLVAFLLLYAWWRRHAESANEQVLRRQAITSAGLLLGVAALAAIVDLAPENRYCFGAWWLVSLLMVGGVWAGLRLRAYRDALPADAEGAPVPLSSWLLARLGKEWPLLAVLMLAPTITLLRGTEFVRDHQYLLPLGLAVLAGWWLLEWRADEDRHPLRNPLALLGNMLRQLWRYKLLLAIFTICLLVSGGVQWGVTVESHLKWSKPHFRTRQSIMSERPYRGPLFVLSSGLGFAQERVPQIALPPVGRYTIHLLHVVLAGWFIWLVLRRPAWLSAPTRRRIRWPAALLVAGALIAVVIAVGLFSRSMWWYQVGHLLLTVQPDSHSHGSGFCDFLPAPPVPIRPLGYPLAFPASAPLLAFVWWIILRIAQRRPWGMRQAARVTAYCWGSIAGLTMLWIAPSVIGSGIARRLGAVDYELYSLCGVAHDLVLIALVLVPWLIVERRMRLWPALAESWRLARARGMDVLVFAIRYWLMMVMAATVIYTVAHIPALVRTPVQPMLEGIAQALGVLTMAAAYLALQGKLAPAAKLPSRL